MKMKRIVALGAACAMLVSSTFLMDTSAFRVRAEQSEEKTGNAVLEQVDSESVKNAALAENEALSESLGLLTEATVKENDMVRVIVTLRGASIIEADSDATANSYTDKKSATLEAQQEKVIKKIENTVLEGEKLDVSYKYTWLLNGFAASVPYGSIDEIKKIAGVENVILQPVYTVCETTKPDADIQTIYDGVMVGREDAWKTGYTGKGMKISVIDTGIDEDHPSFAALPDSALTSDSATKAKVSAVLGQLNASALYPSLTADDVYYSTKIAYGFNYVDANTTFNHSLDEQGDHGTHVAGIAAANNLGEGKVVGVAPDAQLYVMKVFGANGGAYTEDILAAIEDSLMLGADVINMSLGSPAGFTSDGDIIDEIYASVSKTNTILAIAAGNAGSMGQGNLWGTDKNLTGNPDNSTVSSPATYESATSVASVENVAVVSYYFEMAGSRYGYNECVNSTSALALTLAGQELPFVVVDNYGQTLEDFTSAGVEGKIAVVSRGVVSFGSKAILAEAAGAVACIVYNNQNDNINMDMTGSEFSIPCVSVSMKTGAAMVAAYEENAGATVTFSSEQAGVPNEAGYTMSTFSSWGAAPDLSLVPDVAAPGGNIYSCYDGGSYGLMSGTSMATPNMAGVSALVMQYARATRPELSDAELHDFVNALIVSTATPLYNPDGVTYSPRLQGSGLVNAYNSIMTTTFLSVAGMDVPKVELKDDPKKDGKYSYSFDVNNFGKNNQYYNVNTTAQTENVDLTYASLGFKFIDETPYALDAAFTADSDSMVKIYDYTDDGRTRSDDARWLYLGQLDESIQDDADFFRYDLDTDEDSDRPDVQAYLDALVEKTETTDVDLETEMLCVKAGEKASVDVTVKLSDADKKYMDTYFENGIYVEGYTFLEAMNLDGFDLSLPYMAFYGDWTQAPILDSGYYWQSDEELIANQYYNILFTNAGAPSEMNPGINPFFDEAFDPAHISISPNGDGYFDYIDDIYVSLLRNAKELSFTFSDAETGEVYYDLGSYHERKSYYVDNYGICVPFIYSWLLSSEDDYYYFTDKNGNVLPNGTKVKLTVHATLDYDEHASNNLSDTWETVITVDTEEPTVTGAQFVEEGGRRYLDLTFGDNVGVAVILFADLNGNLLAKAPSEEAAPGTLHTQRFDVTDFDDSFLVFFDDYAMNEVGYQLTYQP